MTDEIDASTKHHPTAFITTYHHQRQGPNCTFLCGATVVSAQDTWFVHRSDCPALTFWKLEFSLNEHTSLKQPNVGVFPSQWTIPIAAVASDLIATWPHKQKSFKMDCSPIPPVAALTTAANSDSPLFKARTPIVLTTLSRIGHSTSHLPMFSWSGIQQSFHHQEPQCCCRIGSMGICRSFAGI